MIHRYDFGSPIDTGAVQRQLPISGGELSYFSVSRAHNALRFSLSLDEDDIVFGLGEANRGINKRGHLYTSWNSDDGLHTESKNALYAAHNFLIVFGKRRCFGAFFDDPGMMHFDLGYTKYDEAVITSVNGDLTLYILEGETPLDIVKDLRRLTGRSYVAPKWAFGYIQSRWGYKSEDDVRTIVSEHRKRHIPLDGVCMDIDYMDDYMDFTVDPAGFENLPRFCREMKDAHAHMIPIIDAGVKEKKGYEACDEGLENGYFCTYEDGRPFVGAVWPGRSYFPDFLREDVRAWFGVKYHRFLDAGVDGFWNDMNEPALFYSENGIKEAFAKAERLKDANVGIHEFFRLREVFADMANNPKDYARFYQLADGKRIRHDKVHNLYGAFMTRAAAEGMAAHDPETRRLLFTRSSYIGAHRYGGVWQGDNHSWWSHILLNLKMLPSLNMCGFLYTGADIGGFNGDTTEDLLLRWLQLGVFTPLMRNHSCQGTREQEIYRFSLQEKMRDIVTVRYALIPYLYSEFMKAALTDGCMFRPLAFDYPQDETACRVEDQVMLGSECMIAPVYQQNARGRYVYLPEDMLLVRFRAAGDYDCFPLEAGHHYIELALDEMPLFIRKGCVIPLSSGGEWVDAIDTKRLTLLGWLSGSASYMLYDDDGYVADVQLKDGLTEISVICSAEETSACGKSLVLNTEKLLTD